MRSFVNTSNRKLISSACSYPLSLEEGAYGKPYLKAYIQHGWNDKSQRRSPLFQPTRPDYPEEPDQEPDSKWHKAEYESSRPPPLCHAFPSQKYPTLTVQPAITTKFL
jgi:hypothetical protein